jgi:hypothetical protein
MAHRFDCPPRLARLGSWLPSVLLVTMLAACGHNPSPPEPEPGTPAANVVVSVQNQNVNDVDVVANVNGLRQRLGTVTSQGSSTFEVNWGRIGPAGRFSLIVSPIGGRGAYRSGALTLWPGSQVSLTVAPVLRNSTTEVY